MSILEVSKRWAEVKGKLKNQFAMLTEDDLRLRFGKEGELIVRLQKKLGKSKADVLKIIGES